MQHWVSSASLHDPPFHFADLLVRYTPSLNVLNHLPSINSGPEQVEGNTLNLFYGCQPPPRAR